MGSNHAGNAGSADRGRDRTRVPHEVVFHSYPKLLYCWPLIAVGPVFYFLDGAVAATWLGWVYLFILLIVLMTISVDIERNHGFVWLIIFGLFFFVGRWLADAYQVPVFKQIFNFFEALHTEYNGGFALSLSILLAIPWLVMLVWVRIQHRWRITHNEFEHYSWGRADDSLARGAKRVRSTYPDLLELLLAGAGTLIVYSATGRSELRRIPNVPLIFLVRRRINRILETTAVTSPTRYEAMADEEVETEVDEAATPLHDEEGSLSGESGGIGSDRDPL